MESGNAFKKALIAEVRKHAVLFDGQRRDYKSPALSADAWGKVADALGSTPMECETAFQGLRNRFTHERKRRLRAAATPSLTHGNPWHLYDDIKWLGDYVKMRDRRPGSFKAGGEELEPLPTQAAYFPDSLLHLQLGASLGASEGASPSPRPSAEPKEEAASEDGRDCASQQAASDDCQGQGGLGLDPAALSSLLGLSVGLGALGPAFPAHGGRLGKRQGEAEALAEEVKRTREELEDEELLFGRVVAKALKRLPTLQRAKAKVDVQKLLCDAERDAAQSANGRE